MPIHLSLPSSGDEVNPFLPLGDLTVAVDVDLCAVVVALTSPDRATVAISLAPGKAAELASMLLSSAMFARRLQLEEEDHG